VEYDAVIIGAGFAGVHALYVLRESFTCRVFEAGDGVGGTWFWNRYPGARCDVESLDYSYTFSEALYREWDWSERYPRQPEIERYVNHVVDKFDLRKDIQLSTTVVSAAFDEASGRWIIETDRGDRVSAQFLIAATGCLSAPNAPDFKGLDSFAGEVYQTSLWPKEAVDFTGKRVGLIGTGSSGIQAAPIIAEDAEHLFVFQRTANFSIPAGQRTIDSRVQAERKATIGAWVDQARQTQTGFPVARPPRHVTDYTVEEVRADLDTLWGVAPLTTLANVYDDLSVSEEANEVVSEWVRDKIRATVKDTVTAELLCPKDHPFLAKRLCVDSGYYEMYNRDNVTLVDVRSAPIGQITPDGLRLTDGRDFDLDVIILATGFDGMTGALTRIDIRGRDGWPLVDAWKNGPATYLGLQVARFPNLFMITGPQSPSVLANMLIGMEDHIHFIDGCMKHMRSRSLQTIEPTEEAQDEWVARVLQYADATLVTRANSWWRGANIPGKPQVFMIYLAGLANYRTECDAIVADGYRGFLLAA
jgi:cyclohexanone monooxygenase